MRHKARVKDGHTTHSESSFGKKLWCVLIVLFLGVIGWQVWKLNAYNNAVREAKEAGFEWTCNDTINLIRQDWHNAFKKETWGEHERWLDMVRVPDLGRYREMLHHLRPTELQVYQIKDESLDALKGLTGLKKLAIFGCAALRNVDALKGLTSLQELHLAGCSTLQNVDALAGLTALQVLNLANCLTLQKVDALAGLTSLQELNLRNCPALKNADVLNALTRLNRLDLSSCLALKNVDGLKRLASLQWIDRSPGLPLGGRGPRRPPSLLGAFRVREV